MNRDLPRPAPSGLARDLHVVAAAGLLVLAAVLIGARIQDRHGTLRVNWPPLLADWAPHAGPGTPAALTVAAAVVAYGPALAARLSWRPLLLTVWGASLAWTWSLALVDGWSRGVAEQLTSTHEYLRAVGRFRDIPAALRDFTGHILLDTPDNWPAHVAGHPPGATLTFVVLDRIGLGGGGWAGAFVITVGTTAAVAILIAVRRLADESPTHTAAAPFLVLAPAAVWVGTSADGFFTAVTAWAVALLALAVTGHRPAWTGFGSGLLFGLTMYLSYGLTLFAVIGAAVLLLGTRRLRPLPYLLAGFLVMPVVFTALGFDWWEAYRLLVTRYYQGAGGVRPYGYWIWANLACAVLITGPATVAGLRRGGGLLLRDRARPTRAAAPRLGLLFLSALLALLIADLSGMSKAETERIWLPFAFWLLPAGALLPGPRAWLAGQAVLALLLNHLLLTGW
ncbi:hypothetical protein AB0D65_19200 [Streptomyces griseoloalbus]|uniref:Integral membrane protein n=1 Tax=Streptomyces griseoloalbus TaxID=67303 RepID=A0ABV3E7F5_9ACTN